MVVKLLDLNKDPFDAQEIDEELLSPEILDLSAIGALMYLTNSIWPNIAFAVNLLARFRSSPTKRQ